MIRNVKGEFRKFSAQIEGEDFRTSKVTARIDTLSQSQYSLKGNLTIRGIAKEKSVKVEFGDQNKDPWGNQKSGFSIETVINRKD